jgi:hypothetical protein
MKKPIKIKYTKHFPRPKQRPSKTELFLNKIATAGFIFALGYGLAVYQAGDFNLEALAVEAAHAEDYYPPDMEPLSEEALARAYGFDYMIGDGYSESDRSELDQLFHQVQEQK